MIKETNEIKNSIYIGMSIFNVLKGSIIRINDEIVTFEEKKYLSLYFGLISSKNVLNDEYSNSISELEYRLLDIDEYIELYKNYFIRIFESIDFNSIENYFKFLLEQPIIKKYNSDLSVENNSNKKLIKK